MGTPDWRRYDPLLSDQTRLAILITLARDNKETSFISLIERLDLTRGNLSVHARKLEEGGLIATEKKFFDRKPVTTFRCTDKGHAEIKAYLDNLRTLLQAAF